jgi:acyl transferase domain-containing protein/thioesterase domain-containing protein
MNDIQDTPAGDIAIIGMSVQVPGALSSSEFWNNLREGRESIRSLSDEDLREAGENPQSLSHPDYVRAAAPLNGFADFDAEFFGFSPKDAAILDPQHRKFLETAWEAMEHAGHPPESLDGNIGVYAGCGMGSYFYFNICSNPGLVQDAGMFLLRHTGNDKDFMSTRVSHVFDLKGPSISLQTACSTSLVATHYACQALRDGDCDMALAGGVTIELPHGRGYIYKENEILSPDGHCHAFDHRAQGTVFGSGAGVVALRRLEDALRDGDHIWAVIKGSAINNDGAAKAGYLAPSVEGQTAAVRSALANADVPADSIGYVECHGTGTYLGDPIEVSALTNAYRARTDQTGFCKIGSVKTNIGHLDTAAGVAGLVKTALSLHHGQIPPSLGYEAPNPAIDFDTSPFRVNDRLTDWVSDTPRRAAVNALGVGGTNAHAILEQAPARAPSEDSDFPFHILCVSGRTSRALDANSKALAAHLRDNPNLDLADVAFTLKEGRRGFEKRRVLVAETATEAANLLEQGDPRAVFTHTALGDRAETVFMFPGGGAQYAGMARDLYETEPVFADWMDRGLDHLSGQLDQDIRALWLPEPGQEDTANARLTQPSLQLPLVMIVEYALAQLWQSWGVQPAALVGHSMGENTAACLAGVIGFEDCIDLVALRGRLFDTVPAGGMLSVSLPESDLRDILPSDLDIASVNAPALCAVSGPQAALDAFAFTLTGREIEHQRIQIDIAAHSRMLDPILHQFRAFLTGLDLQTPRLPVISNRTGLPLTDAQATSPDYWVEQLRQTVNFGACVDYLAQRPDRVFLEVGPGKALGTLAQMNPALQPGQAFSSLRHPNQDMDDDAYFLLTIGRLWACGVEADWSQIRGEAKRHRLPLPTYAFQRSRYFIEPGTQAAAPESAALTRSEDLRDWGYRPVWRPQYAACDLDVDQDLESLPTQTWLIFEDTTGVARAAADRLETAGQTVIRVRLGDTFAKLTDGSYLLSPELGRAGYDALVEDLSSNGQLPDRIGHFWLVTQDETFRPGSSFAIRNRECGFDSLVHLAQALGSIDHAAHLVVVTSDAAQTRDEPLPYPEKSLITGPVGVIPRELPGWSCTSLDLQSSDLFLSAKRGRKALSNGIVSQVLETLLAEPGNETAAIRGARRMVQGYKPIALEDTESPVWTQGGTYLITGGFGGIGLAVAQDLIRDHGANVILLGRDPMPSPKGWDAYLQKAAPQDRIARRIRALQELNAIGSETGSGRAIAVAADVCNITQMRTAVDQATDAFGKISGVIHAAGHIDDGLLLARSDSDIEAVLAPKVTGLQVLDQLFPDGSLDLMVLFGSSSTASRPAGQVDYVAANAYLNTLANGRIGAKTKVIAVNWGVWADTGMAADAMAARTSPPAPSERQAITQPLLDETGFDAFGNRIFTASYTTDRWVLDQHRTADGTALMPGTGYIELAAQALAELEETGPFTLRDFYFFRALPVSDHPTEITVRLKETSGGYEFTVYSASGAGYLMHAQAAVDLAPISTRAIDPDAIQARCAPVSQTGPRMMSPQETHLRFGPRWHVLQDMAFGKGEGIATLSLAAADKQDARYRLHPGLMDLATGWAIDLAPDYDGSSLWVPVSYDRIEIHAPLRRILRSWVRLASSAPGFASFDVTLVGADGAICAEITGFQMKHAEDLDLSAPAQPDASAQELGLATGSAPAPLSPDEQRLFHNITQGIRSAEGPEALTRALSSGLRQIYVSSLDLEAVIDQASQSVAGNDEQAQSFERPELDTDYAAPETEIETTLAGLFESLLGVSRVGVHVSFFDLGGHSLIAVRLFAQIKRIYDVEFPISVLFEAPSVARVAERIGALVGDAPAGAPQGVAKETPTESPKAALKSPTHLVKLHGGPGTGETPFFIVAGMFGNVLNLRHLAQQVGTDRAVYGLQARGLIGSDTPHTDMETAAADYIAEIRQIQPHGPYVLGGFSGGGITAYEIAQQLRAHGEEVASLVLLDTPLPMRPELTTQDKIRIKTQELRRKGIGYLGEWAGNRARWELEKRKQTESPLADGLAFNNSGIEAAFREAIGKYDLKPWVGHTTLFRPPLDRHWKGSGGQWISRDREYVLEDNGWSDWISDLTTIEVPGDHDSMVLAPNVRVLAQHIRNDIKAVLGRGPFIAQAAE